MGGVHSEVHVSDPGPDLEGALTETGTTRMFSVRSWMNTRPWESRSGRGGLTMSLADCSSSIASKGDEPFASRASWARAPVASSFNVLKTTTSLSIVHMCLPLGLLKFPSVAASTA